MEAARSTAVSLRALFYQRDQGLNPSWEGVKGGPTVKWFGKLRVMETKELHFYSAIFSWWFILQGTNEIELTRRGQLAQCSFPVRKMSHTLVPD